MECGRGQGLEGRGVRGRRKKGEGGWSLEEGRAWKAEGSERAGEGRGKGGERGGKWKGRGRKRWEALER